MNASARIGDKRGLGPGRAQEETGAEELWPRHLTNHGAHVELCLAAPGKLGLIPARQYKIFRSTGGNEVLPQDLDKEPGPFILDPQIGYPRVPLPVFERISRAIRTLRDDTV